MFRQGQWKYPAALLVGLSAGALALAGDADDVKPAPARPGWLSRWFGGKPPAADKKDKKDKKPAPAPKDKKPGANKDKEAAKKPPPANSPASLRGREMADYLRRLQVCDRLMQVAYDTHDEELQRQIEQLNERIWTTYQLRCERVPARPAMTDEEILDKHLGSRAAKKGATEEAALLDDRPSKRRVGQTASKEDRP
jgi:hypothetical protein